MIARSAVEALDLDRVLFLPCRQSPHKLGDDHASAEHRLAMCQLATKGLDWAYVDEYDLLNPPPNYAWLTAQAMAQRFPGARLFWLMGTDQWQALPRWKHPEKLAELIEFIVFARGTCPTPRDGYRLHQVHGDHPASATAIRQSPYQAPATDWLHPDVAQYIKTHRLYHLDDAP